MPALIDHALLDRLARPLRDLRVSVIDRCNFRCPYCMPEARYPRDHTFMSATERLNPVEIERLARLFVGLGVRKLRLTGGEPLLRRDLPEIVSRLAGLQAAPDLALTSNGALLKRDAAALAAAGLKRVTVSLDALDPAVFATMSGGRGRVEDVLEGLQQAASVGLTPIKLNCVVQRGINESQVMPLVEYGRDTGQIVRFIEYMDVGTCNRWQASAVVPSLELLAQIHARYPLQPVDPAYRGEVAERYRYLDGAGEIGFISSVSQPFCGDCTRARVSADGRLYTCLFAKDGHHLRPLLGGDQGDAAVTAMISAIWQKRQDRYSELRQPAQPTQEGRIEMYRIGG